MLSVNPGYLVVFRIAVRQNNAFNKATVQAIAAIPDKLKKSFTMDYGKGFDAHKELAETTGMKVFLVNLIPRGSVTRTKTSTVCCGSFSYIFNDDFSVRCRMFFSLP